MKLQQQESQITQLRDEIKELKKRIKMLERVLSQTNGRENLFLANLYTNVLKIMRSIERQYRSEASEVHPLRYDTERYTGSLEGRLKPRRDLRRRFSDSSLSTVDDDTLYSIDQIRMLMPVDSNDTFPADTTSCSSDRDPTSELTSSSRLHTEETDSENGIIPAGPGISLPEGAGLSPSVVPQQLVALHCTGVIPSVFSQQLAAQTRVTLKKMSAKPVPSWHKSSTGSEVEQSRLPIGNSRPPPTGHSHPNSPPAQPVPCPRPIPPPVAPKPTRHRPLTNSSSTVRPSLRKTAMAAATPRQETELEKKFREFGVSRCEESHTNDEHEREYTRSSNTDSCSSDETIT